MSNRPQTYRSDLNFAINRKLGDAGIEIPFPQRDLNIRGGILKMEQFPPTSNDDGSGHAGPSAP